MTRGTFQFFGATVDPSTHDCEWCSPPREAVHAFELYRRGKAHTGQFVFACERHREIAEVSADPRKGSQAA